MTFVVEDGTGTVATANSYISTAYFGTYWLDRGVDVGTFSVTLQQNALVRAADYIDLVWGEHFRGFKLLSTQPLEFPRQCLFEPDGFCTPVTGIPERLKRAAAEYGYRSLTGNGELMPDPVTDETGLQVEATYEKVGPIEERKTFLGSSIKRIQPYPKADMLIARYTDGGQGSSYRA